MQISTTAAPAASGENFAALFEESLTRKEMRIGEVITAEVTRVDANHVVVNAGLKSESYIPVDEFRNDRGEVTGLIVDQNGAFGESGRKEFKLEKGML